MNLEMLRQLPKAVFRLTVGKRIETDGDDSFQNQTMANNELESFYGTFLFGSFRVVKK